MKFRLSSLLSLLSGIVLVSTPAVSMSDETSSLSTAATPAIAIKPYEYERVRLKKELQHSSIVDTYSSLRATNSASDDRLIEYIVSTRSLDIKTTWDELTLPKKNWFISSVKKKALKNAVANPDSQLINYSSVRKSGNTAHAEELISYLIGQEAWGKLAVPQKQWFVAKATLADRLAAIKTATPTPSETPVETSSGAASVSSLLSQRNIVRELQSGGVTLRKSRGIPVPLSTTTPGVFEKPALKKTTPPKDSATPTVNSKST